MDRSLKNFMYFSTLLIFFFFTIIIAFGYIYRFSTISTYNYMLLILMSLTIIITVFFIVSVIAVFYAYTNGNLGTSWLWLARGGLNILLPFIMLIGGLLKGNKDAVRNIYISVNNTLVLLKRKKFLPGEVLVLLPHCLQDSSCGYKITNDIKNCRRCGKCCIGEISALVEKTGVSAVVVTGGTAARNIVSKSKPGVILSVACERDLTSGISEVGRIPVIGIVNKRPNGPCFNTTVDIEGLKQKFDEVLSQD